LSLKREGSKGRRRGNRAKKTNGAKTGGKSVVTTYLCVVKKKKKKVLNPNRGRTDSLPKRGGGKSLDVGGWLKKKNGGDHGGQGGV